MRKKLEYLNGAQVCLVLGISRQLLHYYIKTNVLKAKGGKENKFAVWDVAKFVLLSGKASYVNSFKKLLQANDRTDIMEWLDQRLRIF